VLPAASRMACVTRRKDLWSINIAFMSSLQILD
jgi:hypothetical protein